MAEGTAIGALAVRITADVGDFMQMMGRVDTSLERFSKKVDKHAQEWMKFAGAASAAGVALFEFTRRTNQVVDELGKMAQKVGVSVQALSGLKFAAEMSDVSLQDLGTGLKQLSKFMVENGVAGVSVEEQLLRIADQFAAAEDGAEKTALAMKLFGKSGADLIPFLNQGRAGIEELRKEAERLGVVFTDEAAKRAEEFGDNLTRLKTAATGLQVHMAGPLVEALNKVAAAMLEAQKNGDSFFQSIVQGFRTLVTGNDLDKWNKEFVDATDRMMAAQNNVDRLSRLGGEAAARGLRKAREELAAAMADIDRLQRIKPVLAPEQQKPAAEQAKTRIQAPVDAAKAAREAEQREQEVRDAMHRVRVADDERELAQIAKQNEEKEKQERAALQARLDAIDYENDEAIRKGQELLDAERVAAEQKRQIQRQQLADTHTFLGNLAGLMNTNSRKVFEIGKQASLAQAAVKGAQAVMDAWQAGMSIGGPWAPVVAAAYAAAAAANAANLINNIRKQTFGGGGGAPTPPGQGSSGVGSVSVDGGGAGQQRARGPDTIINLRGDDIFTGASVRRLIERINETTRDGGRVAFAE